MQGPVLESVCQLIHDELNLPEQASVTADTPLIGGDHDLDSLDVLMLVTATEKKFGISIPSETIGPEVFRDVGSLSRFIEDRLAQGDGHAS